jgi:Arc/MetJ family transcription regulator
MRTNIDIDDKLMKQAMKATNTPTKKAAVEAALRQTVEASKRSAGCASLFGTSQYGAGHDDDWFASDEEIFNKHREQSPS